MSNGEKKKHIKIWTRLKRETEVIELLNFQLRKQSGLLL